MWVGSGGVVGTMCCLYLDPQLGGYFKIQLEIEQNINCHLWRACWYWALVEHSPLLSPGPPLNVFELERYFASTK